MNKYYVLFIILFFFQNLFAQDDYRLSKFNIIERAIIAGPSSHSKGLDVQFLYSPDTLNGVEHHFSVELICNNEKIAHQEIDFTFTVNDSIAYLIDSIGIDSVGNLDTLVHLYIPYRSIDIPRGMHSTTVLVYKKGDALPIYKRPYRLRQAKIYDLFIDLKSAKVLEDENANPLGLKYNAPDPKWLVDIGVDEQFHGLVNRNEFELKPKDFITSISDFDTVNICVFNDDPTAKEALGCFVVPHSFGDYQKNHQNLKLGDRVIEANFDVKKMERLPATSNFKVTENFDYKSIKGLKVDFEYSLPLNYRRRNIRIKLTDEHQLAIDNVLDLKSDRRQEENRIVGTYSYFISYYNLQKSNRIKLILTGNDKVIREHQTEELVIEKTIEGVQLTQTVGHLYKGISGILYQLDFELPQLPKEGQLKLEFPTLSKETKSKLLYWNAHLPDKLYTGTHRELPSVAKQSIFVFLPYFVAPKNIHLTPRLTIEAIDVPPITLTTFETEAYACPTSLNDIQIHSTSNETFQYTGLAGQLFRFNTTIPDYYHSKGDFEFQIKENGNIMTTGYFINEDVNQAAQFPIHNQKESLVFIPYRFMKAGASYEVTLQAKSSTFALSEARSERFENSEKKVVSVGFYLQRFLSKDWDDCVYKIGIRNNNNLNSTYEHLSYTILLEEEVPANYKADIPKSVDFEVALNDEVIIWLKGKSMRDDQAIRLRTTAAEMQENGNSFELKTKGSVKQVVFKLIPK